MTRVLEFDYIFLETSSREVYQSVSLSVCRSLRVDAGLNEKNVFRNVGVGAIKSTAAERFTNYTDYNG